jgi:hypothetical protein
MMTWLSIYEGGGTVKRQDILDFLDSIPSIVNWRASTGAIFIVSNESARQLADRIHEKLPKLHFVLAPIVGFQCQGFAEKGTWDFINHPKSS